MMLTSICVPVLISYAYYVSSFRVFLTQDFVSLSTQQAVGSSVSAVVNFTGQHGTPRWSIQWKIDNGTRNITVGTGNLLSNLTLEFVEEPNPYSDVGILSFSNTPTTLITSVDPISVRVTLDNLLRSHSGIRFYFFATGVPTERSLPLQVKYCPESQDTLINVRINNIMSMCGLGCSGRYECPDGYIILNLAPVVCLQNARWNVTDADCELNVTGSNSTTTVKAIFIENIYAAGVRGLLLPTVVAKASVLDCQWNYLFDGRFSRFNNTIEVYYGGLCLKNVQNGINETVTCTTTNTSVCSNITFEIPLEFGKLYANFSCDGTPYLNASLNLVYCPFRQDGMFISRPNDKCEYLCEGNYTCPRNQFAVANQRRVVCQKNARWNVTEESCAIRRLRSWRLIPGNYSVYAVGFPNLIANAIIRNSNTLNCLWLYEGEFNYYAFLVNGVCYATIQGTRDRITCIGNNEGSIVSELILSYNLKPGPLEIALRCDNAIYFTARVNVEYCPDVAFSSITTNEPDCGYKCTGSYKCRNDSVRTSVVTECDANAKWDFDANKCFVPDSTLPTNGGELRSKLSTHHTTLRLLLIFLVLFLFL